MRLIDADALIKDIENAGKSVMFTSHHERMIHDDKIEFAIYAIKEAPTIEAEPVRHGRWIRMDDTFARYKCSECGAIEDHSGWEYCHCGAKMDGGAGNAAD